MFFLWRGNFFLVMGGYNSLIHEISWNFPGWQADGDQDGVVRGAGVRELSNECMEKALSCSQ